MVDAQLSLLSTALLELASVRDLIAPPSNPISINSTLVLGNQTSSNDPGTYRDGGWESQIGGTYFQFYADTLNCDVINAANDCSNPTFRANTLALSTPDPQVVTDFGTPYPTQLCDAGADGYRLHFTNVISLNETAGLAFYQNISSNTSVDIDGQAVGSGIVTITYTGSGPLNCTVTPQFWNETEPLWGDHGAIGNSSEGYIYFLGAIDPSQDGGGYSEIFCGRVAIGSQDDLANYQYWNGTDFTSSKLTNLVSNDFAPASVLQNAGQGSITYNNYYNCYIYLYPGPPLSAQIVAATSQTPNGPWSKPVVVYTGDTIYYAPVAQGYFDTSGKTLILDMSIFFPIYLQTVKLTFN